MEKPTDCTVTGACEYENGNLIIFNISLSLFIEDMENPTDCMVTGTCEVDEGEDSEEDDCAAWGTCDDERNIDTV